MTQIIGKRVVIIYNNNLHNRVRLKNLCFFDGLAQSPEFIIHFLQFVLHIALGHDAATSLEPQFAVTTYKRTDGDGLIQRTVEADIANTTTVYLFT